MLLSWLCPPILDTTSEFHTLEKKTWTCITELCEIIELKDAYLEIPADKQMVWHMLSDTTSLILFDHCERGDWNTSLTWTKTPMLCECRLLQGLVLQQRTLNRMLSFRYVVPSMAGPCWACIVLIECSHHLITIQKTVRRRYCEFLVWGRLVCTLSCMWCPLCLQDLVISHGDSLNHCTFCTHMFAQRRVFERSGMSRKLTNWPRSLHPLHCGDAPKTDLDSAAEECMMATGGAVSDLLSKVRRE